MYSFQPVKQGSTARTVSKTVVNVLTTAVMEPMVYVHVVVKMVTKNHFVLHVRLSNAHVYATLKPVVITRSAVEMS